MEDKEVKESLAAQKPYHDWVSNNKVHLKDYVSNESINPPEDFKAIELSQQQVTHAVTREDLDMVFPPMIKNGQEAVFSMGDDIPLAPLSTFPRNLYTYFRQLFAQVTNPPIDPIRERLVMTLGAGFGPERNYLTESPEHARVLNIDSPVLFEHQLAAISDFDGFPAKTIATPWAVSLKLSSPRAW